MKIRLRRFFEEISSCLANLDIHIESANIAEADNIDEFLFDKLSEKEIALLSLGVAVGMIRSALLSLSSEHRPTPRSTQDKMKGTIDLALHRIHIVLAELGTLEIEGTLVEKVQPLLGDFSKLKASVPLLQSEVQALERRIQTQFE